MSIDAFGITWASFDSFLLFVVGRDSRAQVLPLLQAMESVKIQSWLGYDVLIPLTASDFL